MEKISIDEIGSDAYRRDIDRRELTEPLKTSDVAINYYHLEPGEELSGGMHTHMDQEEIFIIVEGEVAFETPNGEIEVTAGDVIRFGPGDFQTGYNDGDTDLVAYALGGPRDSEDVRVPRECVECGHENMRVIPGNDGFAYVCPECGAEPDVE